MQAFHEIRSYESDFMVWHSSYSNISFMAHWHEEIELMYVREGSLKVTVSNQPLIDRQGI